MKNTKSLLLVLMQFVALGYILLTTRFTANATALIFINLGAILILWAVLSMRKSKLRILPQPSRHATLIADGPYRFIRHPMYTGLILSAAGLVIMCPTLVRIAATILLTGVLIVKLHWEEKLLAEKFPEYQSYQKKTFKLFPVIF